MAPQDFTDFLGVFERDLSQYSLIVTTGASGSGKSTLIQKLINNHPSIDGSNFEVIDELNKWSDLIKLLPHMGQKTKLLVASHLPSWIWNFIAPRQKKLLLRTDQSYEKLMPYLTQKKLHVSQTTLENYFRLYGGVYTEIDIISEEYSGTSFDDAFELFHRHSSIHRSHTATI